MSTEEGIDVFNGKFSFFWTINCPTSVITDHFLVVGDCYSCERKGRLEYFLNLRYQCHQYSQAFGSYPISPGFSLVNFVVDDGGLCVVVEVDVVTGFSVDDEPSVIQT